MVPVTTNQINFQWDFPSSIWICNPCWNSTLMWPHPPKNPYVCCLFESQWSVWSFAFQTEFLMFQAYYYLLVNKHSYWKWPFIVDLPIKIGFFHSYVNVYQRVNWSRAYPITDLPCWLTRSHHLVERISGSPNNSVPRTWPSMLPRVHQQTSDIPRLNNTNASSSLSRVWDDVPPKIHLDK